MYDSLRAWMNIPFAIKPFIKYSGTGAKEHGESIESLCYPYDEIKLVRSNTGEEVVSNRHLYIDGSVVIQDLDVVVIEDKEFDVKAISTFYREGKADIKVVYL